MRKLILCILVLLLCCSWAHCSEGEEINEDILFQGLPDEAARLVEEADPGSNSFVDSALSLLMGALGRATDGIRQGLRTSGILLAIALLCGICSTLSHSRSICRIVGALGIFTAVMGSLGSMVELSRSTISQLADFSAILLPAMATVMATSGNPISAGGLHALTILFAQLLSRVILKLLIPGIYLFLGLATIEAAIDNPILGELRELMMWLMEKTLRIFMYGFTFFLTLTGVIGGNADVIAKKTAKAAVSGMIPVVGGILSDAAEYLLNGTAALKNALGVFGMIAVLAITILPFFRVGFQYLIMKATAACSGAVGLKEHCTLLKHISSAMGMLLAMTGSCGILLLISGVCYLKVTVP